MQKKEKKISRKHECKKMPAKRQEENCTGCYSKELRNQMENMWLIYM